MILNRFSSFKTFANILKYTFIVKFSISFEHKMCPIARLIVCRVKANCLLVESEPVGRVLSVKVSLMDPSPYLGKFRRKPRKTPNG